MKLALIISLGIAILTSNALPVRTQPSVRLSQTPPPDTGRSDDPQTSPGGTRFGNLSKCPVVNNPPVAFMPPLAETLADSLTVWFYIPYAPKDIDHLTFVVLDDRGEYVQRPISMPLSGMPGFISMSLPPTSPPLEIGKSYHWYFSIYCAPKDEENRISFQGVIQRVTLSSDLMQQLNVGTPQERFARYLEIRPWYDAFNFLAERRRQNPNSPELKADWDKLLGTKKLSNIASENFSQCCSLVRP